MEQTLRKTLENCHFCIVLWISYSRQRNGKQFYTKDPNLIILDSIVSQVL